MHTYNAHGIVPICININFVVASYTKMQGFIIENWNPEDIKRALWSALEVMKYELKTAQKALKWRYIVNRTASHDMAAMNKTAMQALWNQPYEPHSKSRNELYDLWTNLLAMKSAALELVYNTMTKIS